MITVLAIIFVLSGLFVIGIFLKIAFFQKGFEVDPHLHNKLDLFFRGRFILQYFIKPGEVVYGWKKFILIYQFLFIGAFLLAAGVITYLGS